MLTKYRLNEFRSSLNSKYQSSNVMRFRSLFILICIQLVACNSDSNVSEEFAVTSKKKQIDKPQKTLLCHYDKGEDVVKSLLLPVGKAKGHSRHESDFEPSELYADVDLDGFGDSVSEPILSCGAENLVENNQDCDDSDDTIHPGATDYPANGIDEDCDGVDNNTTGDAKVSLSLDPSVSETNPNVGVSISTDEINPPEVVTPISVPFSIYGAVNGDFYPGSVEVTLQEFDGNLVGDSNLDDIPDLNKLKLYKFVRFEEGGAWHSVGFLKTAKLDETNNLLSVSFSMHATDNPNGAYFLAFDGASKFEVISMPLLTSRMASACSLITNIVEFERITSLGDSQVIPLSIQENGNYLCKTAGETSVLFADFSPINTTAGQAYQWVVQAINKIENLGVANFPADVVLRFGTRDAYVGPFGAEANTRVILNPVENGLFSVTDRGSVLVAIEAQQSSKQLERIVHHELFHYAHYLSVGFEDFPESPNQDWLKEGIASWFEIENIDDPIIEHYQNDLLETNGLWASSYESWIFFKDALNCLNIGSGVVDPESSVNKVSDLLALTKDELVDYLSQSECPIEKVFSQVNVTNLNLEIVGARIPVKNASPSTGQNGLCSIELFEAEHNISNLPTVPAGGAVTFILQPLENYVDEKSKLISARIETEAGLSIVMKTVEEEQIVFNSKLELGQELKSPVRLITIVNKATSGEKIVSNAKLILEFELVEYSSASFGGSGSVLAKGEALLGPAGEEEWVPYACTLSSSFQFDSPKIIVSNKGESVILQSGFTRKFESESSELGCFNWQDQGNTLQFNLTKESCNSYTYTNGSDFQSWGIQMTATSNGQSIATAVEDNWFFSFSDEKNRGSHVGTTRGGDTFSLLLRP